MAKIIINRNCNFGTIDGRIEKSSILMRLIFSALKKGEAIKLVDNENTLMYDIK